MMTRIVRALTFARYMPLEKLVWRARLNVVRRLALRWPPSLGGATPALAADPPMPIFPQRSGMACRATDGWRFTFLGRTVAVGDPVDWSLPGPGPRDQLWRMNLHYMEYLEELDAPSGLALIRQWIAANPPFRAGFWHCSWNSYTLSLRLMCWMQFLARHRLSGDAVGDIAASLVQQTRFLLRNLELDLGGNHLMKNIKALAWASAVFDGAEAARWRDRAVRLLQRELTAQILSDGVHYERSPSYHAQVLADLIEIRRALNSDPLDGDLDRAIAAMGQAVVDLAHPDGTPALFNDAGITMAYPPTQCAALAGGATPRRIFAFADAGYFGAHLADLSIVADMGRVGPDDLPAHAHGDIGSFELSFGGVRMIVDQGVFEYVAGARRAQSRSTASHAALALDGVDQAEFFGAFRCGRRPDVRIDRWEPHENGFVLEGRHDGFAHLPGRPIAIRRFDVTPKTVRVSDRIAGTTDRRVSIGLLLHPECRAEMVRCGVAIHRGQVTIFVESDAQMTIEPAEWWPDMGHTLTTTRLRLTWPAGSVEGAFAIDLAASDYSGAK
jgi:uncharacterized heparinase superfamily protein